MQLAQQGPRRSIAALLAIATDWTGTGMGSLASHIAGSSPSPLWPDEADVHNARKRFARLAYSRAIAEMRSITQSNGGASPRIIPAMAV